MSGKISEVQKYTRWTQVLNGAVTIVAFILVVLFLNEPSRLVDSHWVIWLLVVIGGFHTFEEYIWPGGFIKWINGRHFRSSDEDQPLSARLAFFIDALAGIMILAWITVAGTNYILFALAIASIFLINGMWHLTSTITSRMYSPGAASSALLNVPLGAYVLYFYAANGHAGLLEIAVAYGIGLFVHVALFTYLGRQLRTLPIVR